MSNKLQWVFNKGRHTAMSSKQSKIKFEIYPNADADFYILRYYSIEGFIVEVKYLEGDPLKAVPKLSEYAENLYD